MDRIYALGNCEVQRLWPVLLNDLKVANYLLKMLSLNFKKCKRSLRAKFCNKVMVCLVITITVNNQVYY